MAVRTILAKVSLVGLAFTVATEARSCSLRPFLAFQMAPAAFNLLMGADKQVIRCVMVKGLTIYLYDISFSAPMILMTVTAGDVRHQFAFAVKTGQCGPVRRDFLVTRKAEHVLGAF